MIIVIIFVVIIINNQYSLSKNECTLNPFLHSEMAQTPLENDATHSGESSHLS